MIVCNRSELRRYKLRASRRFPKEYVELCFGATDTSGLYFVEALIQVPQKATKNWVWIPDDDEYEDTIATAESKTGLEFLGTIHSHTRRDACHTPSSMDYSDATKHDEKIFATEKVLKRSGRFEHLIKFCQVGSWACDPAIRLGSLFNATQICSMRAY